MIKKAEMNHPQASSRAGGKATKKEVEVQEDNKIVEDIREEDGPVKEETFKPGAIRDLIFLGKLTDEVESSGYKFKIQTLDADQHQLIIAYMAKRENNYLSFSIIATLAQSIISINGIPFDEVCEGIDIPESEKVRDLNDKKAYVVSKWQSSLTNSLFIKYNELVNKSMNFFGTSNKEKAEQIKK